MMTCTCESCGKQFTAEPEPPEHRLMCGDSTSPADVAAVMDGEHAQLCFTDPPYGADIQYDTHDDTQDALERLIAGFFPLADQVSDLVALTPGINNMRLYQRPDWVLCWFYGAGTGRSPWGFSAWQPILVFGKDPKLAAGEGCHPDGFSKPMSPEDAKENKGLAHACPKPAKTWAFFMDRLSNKKTRIVYEPFSGAGTTIVAAEMNGIICRAIEISPGYAAVALQRLADMGLEPALCAHVSRPAQDPAAVAPAGQPAATGAPTLGKKS